MSNMKKWKGCDFGKFTEQQLIGLLRDCCLVEGEDQKLVRGALSVLPDNEFGILMAFDTIAHEVQEILDRGMIIDDEDQSSLEIIKCIAECRGFVR